MKSTLVFVVLFSLVFGKSIRIQEKENKDAFLEKCGSHHLMQNASDFECHKPYCDCSNNGVCQDGQCACEQGYYGIRCEIPTSVGQACVITSCQNGGVCTAGINRCQCTGNWTGDFCEYPTNGFSCTNSYTDCSNNGYCNLLTGKCICESGYYGAKCEVPTSYGLVCSKFSCKNGGTCSLATKHCICPTGWTGDYCEIPMEGSYCTNDYCDCSNNGACNLATGHCVCDGYYGKFCEIPSSAGLPCSIGLCQNGGTCSTAFKRCMCPSGWTGDFCEYPTHGYTCQSSYSGCSNNGYCNKAFGTCTCQSGYYGLKCEVPTSYGTPCTEGLCENGGTCSEASNFCICPDGWAGDTCSVWVGNWRCQSSYCDCNNNGACNFATGACVCEQGYNAPNCTSS